MQNLKILNSKEIKPIIALIKSQWNADISLEYTFLKNNKDKIYLVNKELSYIELEKLRINSIGLYLGELRHSQLRLSIEGSQLIGPKANKNIYEIQNPKNWLRGEDLETTKSSDSYLIIKYKDDYLGSGFIKENRILNFIPKNRRIRSST